MYSIKTESEREHNISMRRRKQNGHKLFCKRRTRTFFKNAAANYELLLLLLLFNLSLQEDKSEGET